MTKNHLNYLITVSACAAIASVMMGYYLAFTVLKPLTTILVILLLALFKQDNSTTTTLVVVGLIACLGGDVLLLKDSLFAYGLASFLLAHLMFAYIFYSLSKDKLKVAPLFFLTLFAIGFYSLLLPNLGELMFPVAVYQICIGVMCWLGINLSLNRRDQVGRLLCIAGLLFIFSDSMIAVNKFLIPFELSPLIVLGTYWMSITLIANVFTLPTKELRPSMQL